MSLRGTLMESLLTWVNSLKVDEPIERLSQMQDLNIFIKIISKLNGNIDEAARILNLTLEERLKFLQRHCRCGSKAEDLVHWQKILHGENSELEICKVIVLLFYVWNMKCKNAQEWETFDHMTQTELASILRFVLDNEDDLSLDDKLIHFLQRKARVVSTSDSASSSDDTMSPTVPTKKTQVRFLELHRVASSSTMKRLDSPSSPMSEVLHMPQFQIRRLRKQLIEGRDLRDELELELSETKKRLAEKEAQIFLMQQRIERLVVLNERQENQQEPREMEELREKNESLMIRLRDALKQCQDMKTDRIQLERKNDQLSEENGDLSYKVRDLSSRLAQLQDALNETTEEHEASVAGWQKQQSQLETELNTAMTEKKCLEERNQILQEKISMLEDQLKKMEDSESSNKGERLGDVLKLEHLQQEVVALNAKLLALQAQITQMEEEKMAAKADLEAQRLRFEAEKMQLQDIVTNLQTSLSEITFQKEKQDQEARLQEEKLTSHITNLKLEISKLKVSLTQKDQELSGAHKEVEEERRQRGQLEVVLQKQEEASKKNIAELSHQVDHLGSMLRQTEGKLLELNEQLGLNTQQMFSLQQERDKFAKERESAVTMFNEYKNTKEEEVSALGKTCQTLRNNHQAGLVAVEELKKEKAELAHKVQELDATILDLIAKCQNLDAENDTQSKSHTSTLESLRTRLSEQEAQLRVYEQKVSEMDRVSEDNVQIREQLLSLEDTVKNLTELLDKEKENSAKLKSERQKSAELEGSMKILKESRDQAVADLDEKKSTVKKLQSQVTQLDEELRVKTENLQRKLSESSAAIQQREEEIEKLSKEMSKWKDRAERSSQVEATIERLKKDHNEVCQQLANERLKVSQMETEAKATMSTQLDQVRHLEAELSTAKAQLKEKEAQEQKLLHTIQSSEEKLRLTQKEEAEHVSQLEVARSNNEQELQVLSKKLSDEKQKTADLEATLKSLEEQKSEKIFALESQVSSVQAVIQNLEETLQKVSAKLEQKSKQYKESQVKHQQEYAQKEEEVHHLAKEKEKVMAELKTEQEAKLEAEAQLHKCMEVHKNEFSSLQNELSRSLDLITMKESELERLGKEISYREEEIQKEKLSAAGLAKEVEALKVYKESATSQEEQVKQYIQTVKATESEVSALKATLAEKDRQVARLEQDLQRNIREGASVQQQYQATVGEVQALQSRTAELESRCIGLEDAVRASGKEAADAKTAASEKAAASEQKEKGIQTLAAEVQQERRRASELEKKLEESRASLSETESSLEALKKELIHKVQELEQSQKSLSESSRELSSVKSVSQEHEKELSATKAQVAQHQKDMEKKTQEIQSLQKELSNLANKLTSNEHGNAEVKELLVRETSRSNELEQQLRSLQERLEASSKELHEKQGAVQNLTTEALIYKEEAEKQRMMVEGLQKTLSSHQATAAKLEKEIKTWQEKCSHKEEEMTGVQGQVQELASLKDTYQEMKAEQSQRESQHKEELLQSQKALQTLQTELEKTKAEAASVLTLRGDLGEKEKKLETLEKEIKEYHNTVASLQEENKHLAAENATLSQTYDQELKKMQMELVKMSEKNAKELESLRLQSEKKVSESKEQMQEITSKYEHAKSKIVDERQKFQEEKQKMLTQVDQLEAAKKEQSEQVRDLNKQINQQEKTIRNQQQKLKQRDSEAHDEVEKAKKRVSELESQLEKQVQAVEHYKAQMDKAKLHYDSKKQQSQELSEELQSVSREQEKLRKENSDLKGEAERINKELQLSLLQTKEAEQNCKNLSSQVRSLEAQVEFADRQLRELGKFQVSTDAMKSRETLCPPRVTRSHADVSIDSLDMSDEEEHPLNSTRKNGRSHREPSTSTNKSGSPEASSNRLPKKVESLESLYFTPIPNRVKSKLDSSFGSIADLSLDSSKKTRSARRRTTQVINITMTKRTKEEAEPEPESANTSFYSLRSAPSHQSLHQPHHSRRGGKPQPAVSAPALTSLPSMESLVKAEFTSSDDSLNNSVLMNLPGYRPNTRSSARLSQTGGRSSFYLSTCQDEPDPQEDWTRIAELQQRNRACLPHLKTSYPLESRPSILASTITDEEMKTGDPKETLRRATLLPSQIQESVAGTRRMTMTSGGIEHSMAGGGITTRQQRKRVSEESHYGADTPESKKSASCFPRPMTPKDKPETRRMSAAVESKASVSQQPHTSRRQTMAFNILNTPKKLGSTLLKRGLNKKSTPKSTPQGQRGSTSKSPHLSIRKSPSRKSPRTSSATSPKTSKVAQDPQIQFFGRNQKKK